MAGFCGGVLTGISGSGMDITGFAVHTLYFRVSEKTGTPTSVVRVGLGRIVALYHHSSTLYRVS